MYYTLKINDNPPERYTAFGPAITAWKLVCARMEAILNQWWDANLADGVADPLTKFEGDAASWNGWHDCRWVTFPHTLVLPEALLIPEQRILIQEHDIFTEMHARREALVDRARVGITNTEVNHGWQER